MVDAIVWLILLVIPLSNLHKPCCHLWILLTEDFRTPVTHFHEFTLIRKVTCLTHYLYADTLLTPGFEHTAVANDFDKATK